MVPARGVEEVSVGTPDGGGMVDGVTGHGEDGALGEVMGMEGDAGAGRDDAR